MGRYWTQLMEAVARLVRVATRCDREQLDAMANSLNGLAYQFETEIEIRDIQRSDIKDEEP